MIRFVLVVAWLGLLTATPVAARQEVQPRDYPTADQIRVEVTADIKTAVATCVKKVRQELPFTEFEAFIANTQVRTFGNQEELFRFDKCMMEAGWPLDPD